MQVLRDTQGFTLIEIMIATVIIAVALLGVASLTVGIIRGNSFSKRLTVATILAQDRLEEVKRLGYLNSSSAEDTENYGNISGYSGFKRVTAIVNDTPDPKMRTVNVSVYWDLDKHSVLLSTILSE
jgi:type II secretion system protein I